MSRPKNKHKELLQYLEVTKMWLIEKNPVEDDNEIILLNLIRELQVADPIYLAVLRERLKAICQITEKEANPKWGNPFFHWTRYKVWATRTLELLKF